MAWIDVIADITDRGLGRLDWAGSGPTAAGATAAPAVFGDIRCAARRMTILHRGGFGAPERMKLGTPM
jgi:hypothetical protein